jgi:putative transposase
MIEKRDWPHAPSHRWTPGSAYIITGATLHKAHYLRSPDHLNALRTHVFDVSQSRGWDLQAWAILSNHYHLVAHSPGHLTSDKQRLLEVSAFIKTLHSKAGLAINRLDGVRGRKVFYQFWETQLTHDESYFARLHYVHRNPEKHGVVARAEDYPWCSMGWFKRDGNMAFVKSVLSFKIDRVNVEDDF